MLYRRIRNQLTHYCLIGECLWELLRARRALRSFPFEDTARMLNVPLASVQEITEPEQIVRQVRGALGSIHRRIPWRPTCLMRAIAANRLLARRMIASNLVLSVTPAAGITVDAHAWLETCGIVVTGRGEKARYVPIYTFTNAPATSSKAGTKDVRNAPEERDRPCSL